MGDGREGGREGGTVTCPIQQLANRTNLSRRPSTSTRARATQRREETICLKITRLIKALSSFLLVHCINLLKCLITRASRNLSSGILPSHKVIFLQVAACRFKYRGGRQKMAIGMRNQTDRRSIHPSVCVRLFFTTAKVDDDESCLLSKAMRYMFSCLDPPPKY